MFDGSETVNLSSDNENRVSITLRSVLLREIVGTWLSTAGTILIIFNADGTVIYTIAEGSLPGIYAIWGNRIAMTIADEEIIGGTVRINGNMMTITYTSGGVGTYMRQ